MYKFRSQSIGCAGRNVLFDGSRAVAHGMRVLAHNIRAGFIGSGISFHAANAGVHGAYDVGIYVFAGLLKLYRPAVVALFYPGIIFMKHRLCVK